MAHPHLPQQRRAVTVAGITMSETTRSTAPFFYPRFRSPRCVGERSAIARASAGCARLSERRPVPSSAAGGPAGSVGLGFRSRSVVVPHRPLPAGDSAAASWSSDGRGRRDPDKRSRLARFGVDPDTYVPVKQNSRFWTMPLDRERPRTSPADLWSRRTALKNLRRFSAGNCRAGFRHIDAE